jgi:hypothetical protein
MMDDDNDDTIFAALAEDSHTTAYPSKLIRMYARGIIPDRMKGNLKRKNNEETPPAKRAAQEHRLFQFFPVDPGIVVEIKRMADDDDLPEDNVDGAYPMKGDTLCVMPISIPPILLSIDSIQMRSVVFLGIDVMLDSHHNATTTVSTIQCRDLMKWTSFDIVRYSKFTTISSSVSSFGLRLEAGKRSAVDQICMHLETLASDSRSIVLCIMFADTGHSHLARKLLAACHYIYTNSVGEDAGLFDYGIEAGIKSVRMNNGCSTDTIEQETSGGNNLDRHSHDLGELIYTGLTGNRGSVLLDASEKLSSEIRKLASALSVLCARGRVLHVVFTAHPVPVTNSTDMIYLSRDNLI